MLCPPDLVKRLREAYLAEAKRLLERAMFPVAAYDADAMRLARDAVMEHLRTQPEGYVLVPVEPLQALIKDYVRVTSCEYFQRPRSQEPFA